MFQAGFHEINYVAQDAAGNEAKCHFTIHVTSLNDKEIGAPITKVEKPPDCLITLYITVSRTDIKLVICRCPEDVFWSGALARSPENISRCTR